MSSKKPFEAIFSGIKCDNSDCDYRDDEVQQDEYADYVNKPCPECGENLLTEEDYEAAIELTHTMDLLSEIAIAAGLTDEDIDEDDMVRFEVESDTKGGLGLRESKPEMGETEYMITQMMLKGAFQKTQEYIKNAKERGISFDEYVMEVDENPEEKPIEMLHQIKEELSYFKADENVEQLQNKVNEIIALIEEANKN